MIRPFSLVLLFSLLSLTAAAAVTFKMSKECLMLLSDRKDGVNEQAIIRQYQTLIQGEGEVAVAVVSEVLTSPALSPSVRDYISQAYGQPKVHDVWVGFLPGSANHYFGSAAAGYLQLGTRRLALNSHQTRIFADPYELSPRPLHTVFVNSWGMDHDLLHSFIQIDDADAFFRLAEKKIKDKNYYLGMSLSAYLIITELRSQKITAQGYLRDQTTPDFVNTFVPVIMKEVERSRQRLTEYDEKVILKAFGLNSFSEGDLRDYLKDGRPVPSFEEAVQDLSSHALFAFKRETPQIPNSQSERLQ